MVEGLKMYFLLIKKFKKIIKKYKVLYFNIEYIRVRLINLKKYKKTRKSFYNQGGKK